MNTFDLIAKLTAVHGPSGREQAIAQTLLELAQPCADTCQIDTLGNLIVHRKGNGPKVMFAAHMDSIGVVATYLEEKGAVRFGKLGGILAKNVCHMPVRFANGTLGAIKADGKTSEKLTLDRLYIDISAKSRKEAQEKVQIGDTAVFAVPAMQAGNCVISPYLDNRVSCAVLLLALERLAARSEKETQEPTNDLYFVFTVQEELGARGAKTAAYGIDPDFAVAVDVTHACDWPDAPKIGSSVLGGGAAIKIMDSSVICHPAMVQKLTDLAQKQDIAYQMDVLTRGGTDAGEMHKSRLGVQTGGISIPCRYMHTPTETVDLNDVEACISLVAALAKSPLEVEA